MPAVILDVDSVYILVDTVHVPAQLTSPAELVAAARAVLERDGLEGLTLRAVAREAGVSHGAPLRHFPGVATLLSALASEGFEQLYASVDEHLALAGPAATARRRLSYAGRGYVQFAVTNPGVFSLMFRNELIDRSYPPLGETGGRAFNQLVDLVVAAQSEGFAPGEEPVHASVVVWALVHGVATLWIYGDVTGVAPDLELDRIATITDKLLFQADLMKETT
jgi:AcrR family transcriptional regulator